MGLPKPFLVEDNCPFMLSRQWDNTVLADDQETGNSHISGCVEVWFLLQLQYAFLDKSGTSINITDCIGICHAKMLMWIAGNYVTNIRMM